MRHPKSGRELTSAALGLAVLLLFNIAAAPASQLLHIEADAVELDERALTSRYRGNVEIRQGLMQLLAEQVVVHHRPDRQPERIVATGSPARYQQQSDNDQPDVHGQAQRIEYDTTRNELILIGEAILTQGQDQFRSDRIIYHQINKSVLAGSSAQGSERVKITIHPE